MLFIRQAISIGFLLWQIAKGIPLWQKTKGFSGGPSSTGKTTQERLAGGAPPLASPGGVTKNQKTQCKNQKSQRNQRPKAAKPKTPLKKPQEPKKKQIFQ